jgi:MFS family permease
MIGIASDYVNRYVLLAIMSYGSFALVAFLLLEPVQSTSYFVCVFMLLGVAIGSMEPVEKAIVADLIDPEMRSFAFGLLYTVKGFGMLAAGIIVGVLWSYYSAQVAFTYIMIVSLCALFSLLVFARCYRYDLRR